MPNVYAKGHIVCSLLSGHTTQKHTMWMDCLTWITSIMTQRVVINVTGSCCMFHHASQVPSYKTTASSISWQLQSRTEGYCWRLVHTYALNYDNVCIQIGRRH